MSGPRVTVALVDGDFDPAAHLAAFTSGRDDVGAVVSFTGLCRRDGDVETLELEAYPGFTEPQIARIAGEAAQRHGLVALDVIHRVGRVAPGEPIVFVAAASTHRREAFDAADQVMDWLKSRAPFWKKSHTANGSAWVEPRARDLSDAARWDGAD